MVRTNITAKGIETIEDLLAVLRDGSIEIDNNLEIEKACKKYIGEDWKVLKDDREALIETIESRAMEIGQEEVEVEMGEIKMESKALTSEELEKILEDWEKRTTSEKDAMRGKRAVAEFIQKQKGLTPQQKEQALKELWPAVEKMEIREEVELIVGEKTEKEVIDKITEAIVQERETGLPQQEKEVAEEIKRLSDEVAAERRFEEKTENLVAETARQYTEIIGQVTRGEEEVIEKSLREEIVRNIQREPGAEEKEMSPVEIIKDENGRIKVVVGGEETGATGDGQRMMSKGGLATATVRPVSAEEAQKLSKLERELRGKVDELRESADSAGGQLREIRESLLKNGATIGQVKMVRELTLTPPEYERTRKTMVSNGFTEKQAAEVAQEAKLVAGAIKSDGKEVANIPTRLRAMNTLLGGKFRPVADLANKATKLEGQFKQIEAVGRIADLQARINALNPLRLVGKMVPGMEKLVTSFGTQTTAEMAAAIASQIAAHGLKEGTMIALRSILATGKVATATAVRAGATAAAGTAGSTAAVTAAGMALPVPVVGWVVALIIIAAEAAMWLGGKIFKAGKDAIDGFLKSMNWDLGELGLKDKFGGLVGGGMELAVYGVGALFAFFAFMQARLILTGAAITVIIFGLSMVAGSSSMTLNQILPWVANRYVGGGYCVYIGPKEAGSGGDINCDQTVEDQGPIGVDKANFIRVAEMWRAGGGKNAELCFNDVVKRAKAANRSPEYALWAWLHESGASNYTGFPEVEDFGIHGLEDDQGVIPPNEFNRQINKFLVLDPASKCPDLAAEDYWVAFSTNYLTGTCDPEIVVNGFTGRTYADELRKTWSWIASIPLPENIGPGGGTIESVEGEGGDGTNLVVVEEEDGLYLCEVMAESTGEVVGNVPLPTLDPNIKIPEGCPEGLPLKASRQSILVNITQGPLCAKYSHKNMDNAVDFGIVAPIIATHNGIARAGSNSVYGYYVDITGTCQGRTFTTRYAHMPSAPSDWTMKEVKKGDVIGTVNNTGNSTGEHLHYDIRGGSLPLKISSYMGLTKDLTGCCDRVSCSQ